MSSNALKKEKKAIQLNSIVIVFVLSVVVALLTHVVPAGEFAREVVDGRELVVPGSFQFIDSNPISFWEYWTSIPAAWTNGAGNIWMILVVSAMMAVLEATGALDAFLNKALSGRMKGKEELMVILIGTFFSILGSTGTFLTPIIAVVPVGVKAAKKMGYDGVVGFMLTYASTAVGFNAGIMNIYSTAIGQSIAGLPEFSGAGGRVIEHIVFLAITMFATLQYGRRVKADPSKSFIPGHVREDVGESTETVKLSVRQILVGIVTLLGFGLVIFNCLVNGWSNTEITAMFFLMSVAIGIIGGLGANKTAQTFGKGIQGTATIAVIIGMSQLVSLLMSNANILDTVVYYASMPIEFLGPYLGTIALFIFNLCFNFFIPGSTSHAYVVMPIQMGIADLTGIKPQVAIEAFKLGESLTNMIWPTVPTFMACLALLNIPYNKWLKWAFKWVVLGCGGAGIAIMMIWQLVG